jgi:hypothetical protein
MPRLQSAERVSSSNLHCHRLVWYQDRFPKLVWQMRRLDDLYGKYRAG